MPGVGELGEHVTDARRGTSWRGALDAQVGRDAVRDLEADPEDLERQPVGIGAHDGDRALAVGLVDLDRVRGRDTVRLEKDHHVLDGALLLPRRADPSTAHRTDPGHLGKPLRMVLDDVERGETEAADEPLGHHRADAGHEPRSQIALDADERGGRHGHIAFDTKLLAVGPVVLPPAGEPQILARLHAEEVADRRHRVAPAGDGQSDDAPGIRLVDVADALEHALERRGRRVVDNAE